MVQVLLQRRLDPPVAERPLEIVERKGLGHPDTICDEIVEEASRSLARAYLDVAGDLLHYNLDKALLAAGRATPAIGGGRVLEPMRFVFGDRAATECRGMRIPVEEILEEAARAWIGRNLRFVDPREHLVFQSEVRPGSPELSALFGASPRRANDTSAAVGIAPLTETERLVIEAERFLNGRAFKTEFPESGEDVKVMGVRRGRLLELTVAMAFVDRFVTDAARYFERKAEIVSRLRAHLEARVRTVDEVRIGLDTLDRPGAGMEGMYLTVTGTSAEGGDSGQVGRGNSLHGVISTMRPATNEAAAGKNPACHVGKIYNVLAQEIAGRVAAIPGVLEATVFLVSRIGAPLADPHLAAVEVSLAPGMAESDVEAIAASAVAEGLGGAEGFARRWIHGGARSLDLARP